MPAYSSSGSVVTGTTSVVATCPATVAAGDILMFHVQTNGSAIGTVSGWTAGTATAANSRRDQVFYKLAAGTEGGTTVTCSGLTSGTTSTGVVDRFVPSNAGGALSVAFTAVGTDTSITTSAYSATTGTVGYLVNDLAVCVYTVTSTTAVLTAFTSPALARSTDWGTSTNRRNAVQSSGLFMIGLQTAPVTTQNTGFAVITGTGAGSSTVGGIAHVLVIDEIVPVAPATGPLAAYAFGEGTGQTTADLSGNGNTMQCVNGSLVNCNFNWQASGHTGSGVDFGYNFVATDATTGELPIGAAQPTTGLTYECWFKMNASFVANSSGSGTTNLINGGDNFFQGNLLAVDTVKLHSHLTNTGASDDWIEPTWTWDANWHHAAMTWDGATHSLYLDGVLLGSGSLSGTLSWTPSSSIGIGNSGNSFAGTIDDVRIYGYALTNGNILYDMQNPVTSGTTTWTGTVPLGVATTLGLTPIDTLQPTISLAVASSLAVTPLVTRPQTVGFSVGVALATTALVTHPAATPLAVATILGVTPQATYQPTVAFNAATALGVTPQVTYQPLVPLSVATVLNASTGAGTQTGTVPLSVATSLATTPVLTLQPSIAMAVATALGVTPLVTHSATTLMAVSSALATTAVNTYQPLLPMSVATQLAVTPQATYNVVLPLSVATALNATPPTTRTATLNLIIQTVLGLVPDSGHHPIAVTLWTGAVESPLVLAGWWDGVHLIPLTIDGEWDGTATI